MSRINSEVLCDAFREEWMFQIEQAPSILTSPGIVVRKYSRRVNVISIAARLGRTQRE